MLEENGKTPLGLLLLLGFLFLSNLFQEMGDCRPLGFLLGLPFALVALVLSLIGAIVWVLGSLLTCVCPCCCCCAGVANVAMELMTLPFKIVTWFTDKIPC